MQSKGDIAAEVWNLLKRDNEGTERFSKENIAMMKVFVAALLANDYGEYEAVTSIKAFSTFLTIWENAEMRDAITTVFEEDFK